jgi:hypothetical protein
MGVLYMKLITFTLAVFIASTVHAMAGEINVTAKAEDGNTVITCTPSEPGNIDKAYIVLYEEGKGKAARSSMEVSVDNKATYILPGELSQVEGRCRIFMLKKSGISSMPSREETVRNVLTERFSLKVN